MISDDANFSDVRKQDTVAATMGISPGLILRSCFG